MKTAHIVFLFDVDNTLLDNDRVTADLRAFLTQAVGPDEQAHYFAIFEQLRAELGYADYLGALQRYRAAQPQRAEIIKVSLFLLDYPFHERLYPGALDVVAAAGRMGTPVILSDGDVVFQPHKVEVAGLARAFSDNVLILLHKEQELDTVASRFPAAHYVMVDDKLRLLAAIKEVWGTQVTTVFVRQGHYAHNPRDLAGYRPADVTLERIADFLLYDLDRLLAATH